MSHDDHPDRSVDAVVPHGQHATLEREENVRGLRGRVVVVDDEPHLSFLLRLVLEQAGYLVVEAPNGEVALRLVLAAPTQLVVTDRMMPVMNGSALAARLKADPRTASIPILMVSANPDRDAAVDAFLDKPFAPHELARAAERLTTTPDEGAPT